MMICKDRGDARLVRALCGNGAEFVICTSGGAFGPERNDPVLQERSRENGIYIIFVHPCEFLVTGPDGAVVDVALLGDPAQRGDALHISKDEIGGPRDQNRIFYFDLPCPASTDASP